jgi:hypothetical protein
MQGEPRGRAQDDSTFDRRLHHGIKIGVYVVAGVLTALPGNIVGSRFDLAQPTAGPADLLNVMAVLEQPWRSAARSSSRSSPTRRSRARQAT